MKVRASTFLRKFSSSVDKVAFDNVVVGGGVIGLAVSTKLKGSTLLLERNSRCGMETSSRNSEVIHNGIYYKKDSLKERLCIQGRNQLYKFCDKYKVGYRKVGKLIVAQDQTYQLESLLKLKRKGQDLQVPLELLSEQQLERYSFLKGKLALFSKETGIVDSHEYLQVLQYLFEQNELNYLQLNTQVHNLQLNSDSSKWVLDTTNTVDESLKVRVECTNLINCTGLNSCSFTNHSLSLLGIQSSYRYNYLKGNYFKYTHQLNINHLIYPIPDPNLNSLGIHLTLDLNNHIKFGPDTQLLSNVKSEGLDYPKLNYSVDESLRRKFFDAASQYLKGLDINKFQVDYSGIRPKLDLTKVSDFVLRRDGNERVQVVNLVGIESPGLTSSQAIGDYVNDLIHG